MTDNTKTNNMNKPQLKQYIPKPITISAIQYDGTKEMDEMIEYFCPYAYIDRDDEGQNCGLRVMINKEDMEYACEGDYLVLMKDGSLLQADEKAFEDTMCVVENK